VTITHSFADFNLHPQLMTNLSRRGYTTPTPIQDQAIPHVMVGKDVVGLANTGTGKTAAFLLPILHTIANDLSQGALIVVPTRELAVQGEC
jgi:ATP-dependent RNA helicase RhlE